MLDLVGTRANSSARQLLVMASIALLFPIAACNKQPAPEQGAPRSFASPEDAGFDPPPLLTAPKKRSRQGRISLLRT